MGHGVVLVIGEQPLEQLDRFQRMEHASPTSSYIVAVDRLARAHEMYARARECYFQHPDGSICHDTAQLMPDVRYTVVFEPLNGREPFADWARKYYGAALLQAGEAPDVTGAHR